jgi:hypothetical protein
LQEFFADYYAINVDTFSLNLEGVVAGNSQSPWKISLDRTADGLASCILSLKKQPSIRFSGEHLPYVWYMTVFISGRSQMAKQVVLELQKRVSQDPGLYDFKKMENPPVLLVLDRVDDPVTPLLTQVRQFSSFLTLSSGHTKQWFTICLESKTIALI